MRRGPFCVLAPSSGGLMVAPLYWPSKLEKVVWFAHVETRVAPPLLTSANRFKSEFIMTTFCWLIIMSDCNGTHSIKQCAVYGWFLSPRDECPVRGIHGRSSDFCQHHKHCILSSKKKISKSTPNKGWAGNSYLKTLAAQLLNQLLLYMTADRCLSPLEKMSLRIAALILACPRLLQSPHEFTPSWTPREWHWHACADYEHTWWQSPYPCQLIRTRISHQGGFLSFVS